MLYVLLNLKKKHPLANFFRIINNRPVASSLIESSAREQDRELLKDMYYQDDRPADGALVILRESVEQEAGSNESHRMFMVLIPQLGVIRKAGETKTQRESTRRHERACI